MVREISHCSVTRDEEPILSLSDGDAFAYSRDLCSWMWVADGRSPNMEFRRSIATPSEAGVQRNLQSGSAAKNVPSMSLSGMGDFRRAAVESLWHLESMMEYVIALDSASDNQYYLSTYVIRLATAVNEDVESC